MDRHTPRPPLAHPYRAALGLDEVDADAPLGGDERVLQWLFLTIGVLPVAWTVARGGAWGAEPTIGLLLVVAAARPVVTALLGALARLTRPRERG